jgi:hypothetical protein
MDGDTFAPGGGEHNLDMAREIAVVAQSSGFKGWSQADGNQNRYFLINDMLSPTFSSFRDAMYQYHYTGLDMMSTDVKAAKENVKAALATLTKVYTARPNAYLIRVFFDAKSDEVVSIFSGGPNITITDLVENLNRIAPIHASKWTGIRY